MFDQNTFDGKGARKNRRRVFALCHGDPHERSCIKEHFIARVPDLPSMLVSLPLG